MLNSLDPDQTRQKSGLIRVQTVCQGNQQTTMVDKVLMMWDDEHNIYQNNNDNVTHFAFIYCEIMFINRTY